MFEQKFLKFKGKISFDSRGLARIYIPKALIDNTDLNVKVEVDIVITEPPVTEIGA